MNDFARRNLLVLLVGGVALAAFASAWAFGGRGSEADPDLPPAILDAIAGNEPATRWAPSTDDVSIDDADEDLYETAYENPATGFGGDYDVRMTFGEDGFAERLVLPDGEVVEEFESQEIDDDGSLNVTDARGRRFTVDLSEETD